MIKLTQFKLVMLLAIIFTSVSFLVGGFALAQTPGLNAIITNPDDSQGSWYKQNYSPIPLTRGYAPLPVFFEGWQSTVRENIVDYEWNFGDSNAYSGNPNTLRGFNGAHVYEKPGTYTATLTVRNASGGSDSSQITITVLPRDGKTYYIDSSIGNDNYTGLSSTVSGNSGPWRTATKAFSMVNKSFYKKGDEILFKRGQAFEQSGNFRMGENGGGYGYLFSAYGTGAKPFIQYTGAQGGPFLSALSKYGYIGFVDLAFNFESPHRKPDGGAIFSSLVSLVGRGKNFLFLRDESYEVGNSFFGFNTVDDAVRPLNIFMVDTKIANPKTHSYSSVQIGGAMSKLAIINSTLDQSGDHGAYLFSVDKGVISGNTFSRQAFGRTALRIVGRDPNNPTNNVQISDNKFLGWIDPVSKAGATTPHNGGGKRYNFSLVELAPNKPSDQFIKDVVFERNILANAENLLTVANAENVIIRNNLFVSPSDVQTFASLKIGHDSWEKRPSKNIKIIGNTFAFTKNGAGSRFISPIIGINNYKGATVNGQSQHENIQIFNNIFYIPAQKQSKAISIVGGSQALVDAVNSDYNLFSMPSTPGGLNFQIMENGAYKGYTLSNWSSKTGNDTHSISTNNPGFVALPDLSGLTPGEPTSQSASVTEAQNFISALQLSANSPAIDKGMTLTNLLHYDFLNNTRPKGNGFDIGAFESGYAGTVTPPPPIIPTTTPTQINAKADLTWNGSALSLKINPGNFSGIFLGITNQSQIASIGVRHFYTTGGEPWSQIETASYAGQPVTIILNKIRAGQLRANLVAIDKNGQEHFANIDRWTVTLNGNPISAVGGVYEAKLSVIIPQAMSQAEFNWNGNQLGLKINIGTKSIGNYFIGVNSTSDISQIGLHHFYLSGTSPWDFKESFSFNGAWPFNSIISQYRSGILRANIVAIDKNGQEHFANLDNWQALFNGSLINKSGGIFQFNIK
ncbi:MAG: PKD domain-containing protein [Candidatus Buchananbacteria bacterium]